MLQLFTDGATNRATGQAGWGYVIVHDDVVLCAASGFSEELDATVAEYLAIINGLLALPPTMSVMVMTDRDEIAKMTTRKDFGKYGTTKRHLLTLRATIMKLCAPEGTRVKYTKSGKDPYNRYADTIARAACGLVSKSKMRSLSRKRNRARKREQKAAAS